MHTGNRAKDVQPAFDPTAGNTPWISTEPPKTYDPPPFSALSYDKISFVSSDGSSQDSGGGGSDSGGGGGGWVNPPLDPTKPTESFLDATLWHDAKESIWNGTKMTTTFRLTIINAPKNYDIKITGWFDFTNIKDFSPVLPDFISSLLGGAMLSISPLKIYQTDDQGHLELAFGPVDWTPIYLDRLTTLSLFLEFNVTSSTHRAGYTSARAYYIPPT